MDNSDEEVENVTKSVCIKYLFAQCRFTIHSLFISLPFQPPFANVLFSAPTLNIRILHLPKIVLLLSPHILPPTFPHLLSHLRFLPRPLLLMRLRDPPTCHPHQISYTSRMLLPFTSFLFLSFSLFILTKRMQESMG